MREAMKEELLLEEREKKKKARGMTTCTGHRRPSAEIYFSSVARATTEHEPIQKLHHCAGPQKPGRLTSLFFFFFAMG
jgi:hypothetical protein